MSDAPTARPTGSSSPSQPETASSATAGSDATSNGTGRFRPRRDLTPEIRSGVMKSCAIRTDEGWLGSFSVMLTIAVIVAACGMSANSPAVVLGAMLLAPLMTPVLGIAASLAMWLPKPLVRNLLTVLGAIVGSVALSWFLSKILFGVGPLPEEVMSRTSPDLRDLVIALASGAGAAYALVRPAISSSLTGAAVAVALVPPLVSVGVSLERSRFDLVQGASLLFLANLAAIVLMAAVVFVSCGFVPERRLGMSKGKIVAGSVMVAACVVLIAVPLTIASVRTAEEGRTRDAVYEVVERWIGTSDLEILDAQVIGDRVTVHLQGHDAPPSISELTDRLGTVLGTEADVEVDWQQTFAVD